MSPKRRTSRSRGIRISAGQQHIAARQAVNAKSSTFLKIFYYFLSPPVHAEASRRPIKYDFCTCPV
jgi:hypothetical protein